LSHQEDTGMTTHRRSTFIATTAAGIATTCFPRIAGAQDQKLRIAGIFSDVFGEPWYAKESGILAKAGFDAELSNISNGAAVVAAIGGGAIDAGVGDLVSGVNAVNAGVPVMLIAGGGLQISSENNNILVVLKESPINLPKDMIGKTIAVPTVVGLVTASLRAWLSQNGVPVDGVKIVEFPQSGMVPAMQRGSIDVALLSEPTLSASRDAIRDVGHPLDAIAKEFLVSVWYASRTWVEANRPRARKLVAAIYDTARWANSHHAETLQVLIREGKLDGDKIRGMQRVTFATSLTPAMIQPVLNAATTAKIFDKPLDANALITRV
jgi:NitT/TauT family transport system substrate-binding protein